MNTDLSMEVFEFLEEIDDMVEDFVDKIEVDPIRLTANTYITGIRRSSFSYIDMEFHVKEVRTIKLPDINKKITDDGGLYMLEPDGEMWMHVELFAEGIIKGVLNKLRENFKTMKTFHVVELRYKDKNGIKSFYQTVLYQNKKVACKEILKLKKKYDDVKWKFQEYNAVENDNDDELSFKPIHEPTDYEIAVAAAE